MIYSRMERDPFETLMLPKFLKILHVNVKWLKCVMMKAVFESFSMKLNTDNDIQKDQKLLDWKKITKKPKSSNQISF